MKKKLVLAIPNLYGGTGNFCRGLANGLKKYFPGRYHIALLLLDDKDLKGEDENYFDEVNILHLPAHTNIKRIADVLLHLYKVNNYLKEIKPHIILSIGTYMNIVCSLTKFHSIILSEHDVPSVRLRHSKHSQAIRFFMKRIYHNKLVVGNSKVIADDLITNFNALNSKVIYYGIDISRINALADQSRNCMEIEKPYIVAVGRLTLQKDFATLLEAFAKVVQKGFDEDLVIIGEGEEEGSLSNLAKGLGISSRVHFLGYRGNPYPCMKRAKLFALSSLWEGFPYALLEALALGLPCVATDCPSGPAEMLDHGAYGMLVKPKDIYGLGEAMGHLLSDSQKLKEQSVKSLRRAKEFSIENMTRAYVDYFERTSDGRS
jgi:glycosyltransferase involved in cell wall biosynthesis